MRRRRRRLGWRWTRSKNYIFAVSAVFALLFSGAIGMTIAYLTHQSGLTNQFEVANVAASVEETFNPDEGTKKDVSIQNDSSVPAYVRAAVTVWWEDKDGNVLWGTPEAGTDYEITWNLSSDTSTSGWVKGTDGFYYYTSPLDPKGSYDASDTPGTSDGKDRTENLINSCTEIGADEHHAAGKYLVIDIAVQSIQADPSQAVTEAWGDDNGGSVTGVSADGSLTISTGSTGGEEDAS